VLRQAGLLPGARLRSLDAIHLAAALSLGAEAVLTYDDRLAEAARGLGMTVLSPGR
jgi:predicted nucleic acid-binding protein